MIIDWSKLAKHIIKTGEIELLERRASKSACLERWEDGKGVPGVDMLEVRDLSMTKAGE